MSKIFKPERKENVISEMEYCVPVKADALKKIVTNREYMIFVKNNKTKEETTVELDYLMYYLDESLELSDTISDDPYKNEKISIN